MDSFGNTIIDSGFFNTYMTYFFNLILDPTDTRLPLHCQCACSGCVYFNVYYDKYLKNLVIDDDFVIVKNIDTVVIDVWSKPQYCIHPTCVTDRKYLHYRNATSLDFTFRDIKDFLTTLEIQYENMFKIDIHAQDNMIVGSLCDCYFMNCFKVMYDSYYTDLRSGRMLKLRTNTLSFEIITGDCPDHSPLVSKLPHRVKQRCTSETRTFVNESGYNIFDHGEFYDVNNPDILTDPLLIQLDDYRIRNAIPYECI